MFAQIVQVNQVLHLVHSIHFGATMLHVYVLLQAVIYINDLFFVHNKETTTFWRL